MDWAELSYQNGWVNYGDNENADAAFCRRNGIVYLKGLVKDGITSSTTVIATLPLGCRPERNSHFTTWSVNYPIYLRINAAGQLNIGGAIAGGVVNSAWVSLDGISYPAAR